MTTIGSPSSIHYVDRAAQIERHVKAYGGKITVEEAAAHFEESDLNKLKAAQGTERFLRGEGTYLGSWQNGKVIWDYEGYARNIELARQARSKSYAHMSGPVTINALDVDSAVTAQGKLTGGDLKNLSVYADYLRNELAAAQSVKSDVTFVGGWGKDRVTTDVNEYISWLFEAAQQVPQEATTDATVSSSPSSNTPLDRAAQIEVFVKASKGRLTAEQVRAGLEESDRIKLQIHQTFERYLADKTLYTATSASNKSLEPGLTRSKSNALLPGPANFKALDIDTAVTALGKLTGSDLKGLSRSLSAYADYIRDELAAAKQGKSDATFTGTWGDRVTTDVDEYIGWLFEAVQARSRRAA